MSCKIDLSSGLAPVFVSQSEIEIAAESMNDLEAAFRQRMRAVDTYAGFLGIELLRDVRKPGRYLLLTRWESQQDFHRYLKSPSFKQAHKRQHKGVSEPAGGAPLRQFEVVKLES